MYRCSSNFSLRAARGSPGGHRCSQVSWRNENTEALAPDDHAVIVLRTDAGRDRIALAALEGAQAAEVDEHHVFQVGRCVDRRLWDQIDVERWSRPDFEIGLEKHGALIHAD